MKTKERIIAAAIHLFNTHGISQVSLRQIAAHLNMSHGNLAYHYKSKKEMLHIIYTNMDEEMSGAVLPGGDLSLLHYHQLIKRVSEFQKRHKFFYMDMLHIAREYPEIIKRYRVTVNKRSEEYEDLIRIYLKKELIKEEEQEGFYKSLFHSIWVMSSFWLQQLKILGSDHPLIQSGNDIKHVWEIILPHLTPKGIKEYRSFIDKESQDLRPIQKKYLNPLN